MKLAISVLAFAFVAGCATAPPTGSVKEVMADAVGSCTSVGSVAGSNSIFVGLSASIGREQAKNAALSQVVEKGGNAVVWSQMGTSLTNEWTGTAYKC